MASVEKGPKRVTWPTLKVLAALLSEPGRRDWYGLEVCRQTGLGSSTVTQVMFRLEQWGWVDSEWEDGDVALRGGRPRRRFYWLTGLGEREAAAFVDTSFHGLMRLTPSHG
jgi:DNA-binding MarR family transcriptional regulator